MFNRLIVAALAVACGSAASAQIADPSTLLKTVDDQKYERQGYILWNHEPEEAWGMRLRDVPINIEKVFVRWRPQEDRRNDVNVIICFDRRLQEVERNSLRAGKWFNAEIMFSDGTSVQARLDTLFSNYDLAETPLKERCWIIGEHGWHPGKRWQDLLAVPHEKRFRAENIVKVIVKVSRATKYEGVIETTSETTQVVPYIDPTRQIYKSSGPAEVVPMTEEFVRGSVFGEALRLARECPQLKLKSPYEPPVESDVSEYAQGFANGWGNGDRFLTKQENACAVVSEIADIKQSGVTSPLALVPR